MTSLSYDTAVGLRTQKEEDDSQQETQETPEPAVLDVQSSGTTGDTSVGHFKCPFSDQTVEADNQTLDLTQSKISFHKGHGVKSVPPHTRTKSGPENTAVAVAPSEENSTLNVAPNVTNGALNVAPNVTNGAPNEGPNVNNSDLGVTPNLDGKDHSAVAATQDKKEASEQDGDIVVVTGGCGFLGQHIVKMLQLRATHVSEIWVYDVNPFQQKLEYQATKKVKSITGSVTDARYVTHALKGAKSVIHVAGCASWGTFPDFEGMERVNTTGTLNVLNACLKNNVERLIYCSTVDVAIGHQPIRGGDETNTPVPDTFLFPGYPETKYNGERVLLATPKDKRGGTLQTAVLRANVCYGELDSSYVINALKSAKQNNGVLYQVGDGSAMFQQAYVGNTAWAFVCADLAMKNNPQLSDQIFYIPDNTPIQNSFNFIRPYLEARGFRLAPRPLPYPLMHGAVSLAELFVKGLSPLVRLSLPAQSHTLQYINTDLYFCGNKARKMLNFEPIFSPNEARAQSLKYYTAVNLDEKPSQELKPPK
ncbi:3 beta-hydroxysteroid dehydrogenase type 7-like [Physella acuta]|uniref:3 beta-hydroxysteroid dehydrogenase type 7-like n=1 Tax=Physella acuta TaxID=109671 RepID=UPI0027DE931B|nr:3 beta-hydroxysteroid dehydrogenase type 7-like [Physella acuta]